MKNPGERVIHIGSMVKYQRDLAESLNFKFMDVKPVILTTIIFDRVIPVYSIAEAVGLSARILSAVSIGKNYANISCVSGGRTLWRSFLSDLDNPILGRTESTSEILIHMHNVINKHTLYDAYELPDWNNIDDILERKHYATFSASCYLDMELMHEKLQDSYIAIGDAGILVNSSMKLDSLSLVHKAYPVAVLCNFIYGDRVFFMMKDKQNDNRNKLIGEFVLLCFLISYVLSTRRTSNLMR